MATATRGNNRTIQFEGEHSYVPGIARYGWKLDTSFLRPGASVSAQQLNAMHKWSITLKENQGLPPFILNYGAHGRSQALADLLKDAVLLENGRGSIVFGVYSFAKSGQTFEIPVFGFSTGMGISSSEIFVKEIAAHVSDAPAYHFNGKRVFADSTILIRVGTCGGCNFDLGGRLLEPVIDRPSLVNASFNLASLYSSIIETSPAPPIFDIGKNGDFARFWKEERNTDLVQEGEWVFLKNYNSPIVVEAIRVSADARGLVCYTGGALSKGALGMESRHPEIFGALRNNKGVFASEMEQAGTANLVNMFAAENGIKALTGMIALIIGAIPGSGFPVFGNPKHDKEVATGMGNALQVGLDALASLAGFKGKD